MRFLYTIIYLAALPLVVPWFAWRVLVKKKYRKSIRGMLGLHKPRPNPTKGETYWIHAVSVGEVNAAGAMIREIKQKHQDARIVLSTTTETGQDHACKCFGRIIDDIFYYPLDFSWIVNSFLDRVRPTHYMLMETELWPIMLLNCARRGVKIYMMNGKLSPRSFRRYMRLRWLFKKPLSGIRAFCMQTPIDGKRMQRLTQRKDVVHVTGNCKFDSPMEKLDDKQRSELQLRWSINSGRPIVVVGSTHSGEEEIVLKAFQKLQKKHPAVAMVLAPRHPERFDEVYRLVDEQGLNVIRTSEMGKNGDIESPEVVLIDEMGVLQKAYGVGNVAVIAGSFTFSEKFGGHNLLEAAVHDVPVVFGPYMHKQKELVRFFEDELSGGVQSKPDKLGETLAELLSDPQHCKELGVHAGETFLANRGSARRNLEIMEQYDAQE